MVTGQQLLSWGYQLALQLAWGKVAAELMFNPALCGSTCHTSAPELRSRNDRIG